jgi:SulP family sulfate permease
MRAFAGCSEDDFVALEAVVEEHSAKADKKLFKAGAGDEALYLIRRGTVKLMVPLHKKEAYHLATCGPGEVIGGLGFVEARGHATDALALTDTDVYMLTRRNFDALERQHPMLALR